MNDEEQHESEGSEQDEQPDDSREDIQLRSAFRHSVEEGMARLHRSWPGLLATGLMGGLDVSMGVLALLVVQEATGSAMLGAMAFSIGFIALALGKSELFTENFMVPVAAVAARKAGVPRLLRLWSGTLVMNLVGGWLFAWLIVWGLPHVHATAVEIGAIFADMSTGRAVALGLMGGAAITLMTWMENGAQSDFSRLVSVVSVAFLLAAGHLNHVIVVSLEMFVAFHTGAAPFDYGDWARIAGIAAISNVAGGLVLVTVLRLVQVGRAPIEKERLRPTDTPLQDQEE